MTLYLHECHHVIGQHEEEFEAAYRDPGGWMDRLGQGDEARLLWYANQVHGTGPAYRVITITAVHDGAAWERLSHRVLHGDLAEWTHSVDRLRRTVTAKVLTPVPWSPITDLDLAAEPAEPADHEPTLFMEDTGWPHVPLDDYLDYWGDTYLPMLQSLPDRMRMLEIQICWTSMLGAGLRPEGILWQRIHNLDALLALFTTEVPAAYKAPGTYMADALTYRDQWESRLLRTSPWSPRS